MTLQVVPDGGLINRSSIEAMRAWSVILGVRQVEILVAVGAVGPRYEDVRCYLDDPFCFSSRDPLFGISPARSAPPVLEPSLDSLAA